MHTDEIVVLPSGTEISIEAAIGDVLRVRDRIVDFTDLQGEASDLQYVAELLAFLAEIS